MPSVRQPSVLQVVHGFPPRETAGTERATARLVERLRRRGWDCHVFAATRAPGRPPYTLLQDGCEDPAGRQGAGEDRSEGALRITRVVTPLPGGSLASAGRDRAVETLLARVVRRTRPHLVHVQHLAWLSSVLPPPVYRVPVVGTLHDHWPWCPAGGTLLREDLTPCPGPSAFRCPTCYAAWAPRPSRFERVALAAAGGLSQLVAPERLHRLWRRLPAGWRAAVSGPSGAGRSDPGARDPGAPDPGAPDARAAFHHRQATWRRTWRRFDVRIAPSRYLARAAEAEGLGPVRVIPHGLDASVRPHGGAARGPLVFLGSVLPHKGAHVVAEAWRRAWPHRDGPPLWIHGPLGDPGYARGLDPAPRGPVSADRVPELLASARALVLGSLWPENAPLVVLEARAAGCPVVAPRIGGLPERVQEGRDGWLYPPGDVAALSRLLRKRFDPSSPPEQLPLRPPPSLDDQVDAVEAIYRELVARGARGGGP